MTGAIPRLTFFVPGRPVPQGSKTAFVNKKTGKPVVVDKDMRLPEWRMKVTAHARQSTSHHTTALDYPLVGPIGVSIDFFLARPRGHFGTGKNAGTVKPSSPKYPATMPDLDKLLRAIFDGVTDAQVWLDDGQVVWCKTAKYYVQPGDEAGVSITIGVMP